MEKNTDNPNYRRLAETLHMSFYGQEWKTAKELSKECYVSESTITNFAKKLGYSGYRELKWDLIKTREDYSRPDNKDKNLKQLMENYNDSIKTQLDNTLNHISVLNNFLAEFEESPNLFLFSSYQLDDMAEYFADLINLKKINLFYNRTKLYAYLNVDKIQKNDMVVVFDSGQDTKLLEYTFEKARTKTDKVYVFASKSQSEKVLSPDRTVILDLPGIKTHNSSRHLVLLYYINFLDHALWK